MEQRLVRHITLSHCSRALMHAMGRGGGLQLWEAGMARLGRVVPCAFNTAVRFIVEIAVHFERISSFHVQPLLLPHRITLLSRDYCLVILFCAGAVSDHGSVLAWPA
jgi:hypothetical protein